MSYTDNLMRIRDLLELFSDDACSYAADTVIYFVKDQSRYLIVRTYYIFESQHYP